MPSLSETLFKRYGPPAKIKYPPRKAKARGSKQRLKLKLIKKEAKIKQLEELLEDKQAIIRCYTQQLELLSGEKQELEHKVQQLHLQEGRTVRLAQQIILDIKNNLLSVDQKIGKRLNEFKLFSALENHNSNH